MVWEKDLSASDSMSEGSEYWDWIGVETRSKGEAMPSSSRSSDTALVSTSSACEAERGAYFVNMYSASS